MSNKITTKQIVHGASSLADVLDAKVGVSVDFSTTWDPPAIAAGQTLTATFVVPTAALADFVNIGFTQNLSGLVVTGYVSSIGNVTLVLFNPTAGTINLASGTLKLRLTRSA